MANEKESRREFTPGSRPSGIMLKAYYAMDRVDDTLDTIVSYVPIPFSDLRSARLTYTIVGLICALLMGASMDLIDPVLYHLFTRQQIDMVPILVMDEGGVLGLGLVGAMAGLACAGLGYGASRLVLMKIKNNLLVPIITGSIGILLAATVSAFGFVNIFYAPLGYPYIGPSLTVPVMVTAVAASAVLSKSRVLGWTSLGFTLVVALASSFYGVSYNLPLIIIFVIATLIHLETTLTAGRLEQLRLDESTRIRIHKQNYVNFVTREKKFRRAVHMDDMDLPKVDDGVDEEEEDPWVTSLLEVLYKGHFRALTRVVLVIGFLLILLPLFYLGWLFLVGFLPNWTGGPIFAESLLSTTPVGILIPTVIAFFVLYQLKRTRYGPPEFVQEKEEPEDEEDDSDLDQYEDEDDWYEDGWEQGEAW